MTVATLAGLTVTRALVQLPAWGVWWADVELDREAELSGPVVLELADLTLAGTVVAGGNAIGKSKWRIAGGAGAWGRELPAKGYSDDAGVKPRTVLLDAAQAAGETLDTATLPAAAVRLGARFAREGTAPASWALNVLAPETWYVGEDGVTRLGKRPLRAVTSAYQAEPIDRASGVLRVAAESIAELVPGAQLEGLTAVDVQHELAPTGLRTTIWGDTAASTTRRLAAYRAIFDSLYPRLRYLGVYEYRVVSLSDEKLNLQIVKSSARLPDLRRVPIRPGVAGTRLRPAMGSRVLVGFVDADPSRPVVLGFEEYGSETFEHQELYLSDADDVAVADPTGRILRWGDVVNFPGSPGPAPLMPAVPVSVSRVRA